MRIRGLLIAAILLAGLGAGVWWSNKKEKEGAAKPKPGAPPTVVAVSDDQLKQLEFKRKDTEPCIIQRVDAGQWKMTAPQPLPVDSDAVLSVTGALGSLTADRVVEEKAGDLAQFGLAQPSFELDIAKKDGKNIDLQFGDDSPAGGGVYAKLAGDPRVFLLASSTKSSLDKTYQDLRDKRLLRFDSDKLSRVELTARKQTIEFGRINQTDWQIVKPKPLRADGWQVEELIRKLREAKMDTSISNEDAKKAAAAFASGTPVAIAKVTDPSGTEQLDIRKNKDEYYAKSSVVEGVFKVSKELGDGVDKSLDDFRNKKLFDFGFNEPNKIDYKDNARTVSYQKSGEKWTSNAGKEIDTTSLQAFIDKLRDLSATKFVDSGFTTPLIEIGVVSNDGKRTEKVLISKQGNSYFAMRENEPSIYELDGKAVEELQKAAGEVKEAAPQKPAGKK